MKYFDVMKVEHTEKLVEEKLINKLVEVLEGYRKDYSEIVILCVGTDRSTGDSLGPQVGTYLQNMKCTFSVYGTLENPIHAMNLEEGIEEIKTNHFNPFIIAIDACLGQLSSVGSIQIGHGPLKPGAGVNKELPPVGNIYMTGIVNVGGFMEYFVLQNTRLSLVMSMANVIATSLNEVSMIVEEAKRKNS